MKIKIQISIFLFLLFSSLISQDKQKVILDCDLGDDIDDVFAVALTFISPEFNVLGLVMDYGNTPKRAQIACRMECPLRCRGLESLCLQRCSYYLYSS